MIARGGGGCDKYINASREEKHDKIGIEKTELLIRIRFFPLIFKWFKNKNLILMSQYKI